MKRITSFLFSMLFSVMLLIAFATAIAYATFIENDYGTATAQVLVYQSRWFELLLVLGLVNLVGSMFKYNLVVLKKWAILLFHLAFVFIILGAGVTRYFGFEGNMHIREGETNNKVVSDETFIAATIGSGENSVGRLTKVKFTPNLSNKYMEEFSVDGKKVVIENELFVPSADETILPDEKGVPMIAMVYFGDGGVQKELLLAEGEYKSFPQISFGFGSAGGSAKIMFSNSGNDLNLVAADTILLSVAAGAEAVKIAPQTPAPVQLNRFYITAPNTGFVVRQYLPKAAPALAQIQPNQHVAGRDAFTARIVSGEEVRKLNVFQNQDVEDAAECSINGVTVRLSYGSVVKELPFSIQLRDFQIERYPGSRSPSSYASEVTLKDPAKGTDRPFRIFMNNILNYKGYRFFQSSFDQDEKGTVLSVNQDYWGTAITYFGYFLMTLGMIFTVFSKSSRFMTLIRLSGKLQASRQVMKLLVVGFFLSSLNLHASEASQVTKKSHIKDFAALLVQDHQGRIEPVSTLASDLLRKISKENSWNGMSSVEVFLDMGANPEKWKDIQFIKVANSDLQRELGGMGGFVSFAQMFDKAGNYRLGTKVEAAYNKSQTQRNKYDKEIINLDERVNICYQILRGEFLRIFPIPNDENKAWANQEAIPESLPKEDKDFASNILNLYYSAYNSSLSSGNWKETAEYLGYIKKFQTTYGADIIPSETKVNLEILYNKWNIFGWLAKILVFAGFLMLAFHFVLIFKPTAQTKKFIGAGTYLLAAMFLAYTAGLALRWYISGHAPWSNGYETMIYVGWATFLSGFIFVKRSPITLAVTTILAAIILFVAGMSWMNPEITNLVPVLKSYWLIVHVAIITASYGFLGMGALLGILNLVLMILRSRRNTQNISFTILEVSYIIEMALIIGLFMLTIGAFIGGVWANESWGRYWGWDPKETWALVTILVYAVILHLRKVPGLKSTFALSSLAVVGLASVLMTFFGVNYYLSGMHSYAQGDPPPIPSALYVSVAAIFLLIVMAKIANDKTGSVADPNDAED